MIKLLLEAKEALINRDAVKCYNPGHIDCGCTLCNIEKYVSNYNSISDIKKEIGDLSNNYLIDREQFRYRLKKIKIKLENIL